MLDIYSFVQGAVNLGFRIFTILLAVYYLLSWLPGARESALGEILTRICEPYVGFFRKFIPPLGFLSIASIVAFAVLPIIQQGVHIVIDFIFRLFI